MSLRAEGFYVRTVSLSSSADHWDGPGEGGEACLCLAGVTQELLNSGSQRRLTWKLVDTKLEKGNWSMSGGRVRLGRAGTSGGRDSVMFPVSTAWWSGKEDKRQPRTLKTAALPVRLPTTADRVPTPRGLTFSPLQQSSQLGWDLQAPQVLGV